MTEEPRSEAVGAGADSLMSRRRIALRRSYALISEDAIEVKQARAGLVVPLVQALIAAAAVWLLASYLNRLPIALSMVLLLVVLFLGPAAVLGVVYNVVGSSFLMERRKGSARWQQGFLGLGIGTRELVPFERIARIEVVSDFEEELASGDLQDVVTWTVQLVKDNDRELEIGAVAAARPLADEALERANELATALARMATAPAELAALPAWALVDYEDDAADLGRREGAPDVVGDGAEHSRRRYRRVEDTQGGPISD